MGFDTDTTPPETGRSREGRTIDASTLIPLGSFLTLLGIGVGGSMWGQSVMAQLEDLTSAVERMTEDRWTYHDQRNWVELLKLSNPSDDVVIPDAVRSGSGY